MDGKADRWLDRCLSNYWMDVCWTDRLLDGLLNEHTAR